MKSDIADNPMCRLAISGRWQALSNVAELVRVRVTGPGPEFPRIQLQKKSGGDVRRWFSVCQILLAMTSLLQTEPADAQFSSPPAPGIAVEGSGEVKTIPDVVEINLRLVAKGELTDDAIVKHRDARKRTMETFKALKLENLKLEEKDLTLRPGNSQEMMQMMMSGMPASQNKRTQIEIGSMLRARLTNVSNIPTEDLMSTIGKLIDAAQDSGAGLGASDSDMMMMRYYGGYQRQSPLVKFVVTNLADIREKAYELAVEDARKRAERLARLSGVKLGSVVAIEELETGVPHQTPYYYPQPDDNSNVDKTELVADSLSGGRIMVRLRVRFGIEGASAAVPAAATGALTPTTSAKGRSQ